MASTYTNDLRLELIATGEAAATWGDKTNTNLTNIAAAFGYATQNGFSSDANSTTTVADGSADPARAMYFKVTSSATLTAARTLTIAPNTISRVMWIENATTGGQSIAISQGTGANVTIATGKTAVVYLDGAGSGAAVVDAMAGVDPGVTDTLAEVLAAGNATGGTDIAVGTGDDITFADSSKAIFGAGSDLQIYHNGSNSYIQDHGTGDLIIAGTNLSLRNFSTDELFFDGTANGAVRLWYDGSAKLATTSTGIDVTGTATMDGLVVSGTAGTLATLDRTGSNGVYLALTDNSGSNVYLGNSGGQFQVQTAGASYSSKLTVESNGDVSLYEDQGVTPKFFWDASAESLNLGTTSLTTLGTFVVQQSADSKGIALIDSAAANTFFIENQGDEVKFRLNATSPFTFTHNTEERMRIDGATGNVGIGTTSPAELVEIYGTEASGSVELLLTNVGDGGVSTTPYTAIRSRLNPTRNGGEIRFGRDSNYGDAASADSNIQFWTALNDTNVERLRISSTGNVTVKASGADQARTLSLQGTNGASETYQFNLVADGENAAAKFMVGVGGGAAGEAARFDSSQNFLVGTTSVAVSSSTGSVTGTVINSTGLFEAAKTGTVMELNRLTDAGKVLTIRQDGTSIGSINLWDQSGTSRPGFVNHDSNGLGIYRSNATSAKIVPLKAGALDDGTAVDLGNSNARFKDLYLSSGIYLDTASTNATIAMARADNARNNMLKFSTAGTDDFIVGQRNDGTSDFRFYSYGTSSDAVSITRSGNLLVGGTTTTPHTNYTTPSTAFMANGEIRSAASGSAVIQLNRTSSDGDIAVFRKSGTTVASIGTYSGDLWIGQGNTGLLFNDGADVLRPANASGGNRDGIYDLGASDSRFKDLYLSGAAKVGALETTTAGTSNFVAGVNAGNSIVSGGNYNVVVGDEAGTAISQGDANVAVGYTSLDNDTLGSRSVAIGHGTLTTQNFTSATNAYNTAVGYDAGRSVSSGTENVLIGGLAGYGMSTGSSNVSVGVNAMGAGIVTGDNNTVMGYTAGISVSSGDNNLLLGKDAGRTGSPGGNITTTSNIIVLGDENIATFNCQQDVTAASDARDKTDFASLDLGLDFVKALAPVTYKWDKRSNYGDKSAEDYDLAAQTPDGTYKEDWLDIGFKAQEVEALEIAAGYNKDKKTNLVSSHTDDGKQMGLRYSKFVPILVKAIQDQQALIESLTDRIAALEE